MSKVNYQETLYSRISRNQLKKEIVTATQSSKELRNEIARVFQQANRRIQNVERTGVVSPAVMSLNKGNIKGFTKFSMRQSWEDLKIEYAKAVKFLQQPTSTAQGTRQYGRHIQKEYGLSDEEYNLMSSKLMGKSSSIANEKFLENYLFRYKDFTDELEREAKDISTMIENDAFKIARELDENIERDAENVLLENEKRVQELVDRIENTLKRLR